MELVFYLKIQESKIMKHIIKHLLMAIIIVVSVNGVHAQTEQDSSKMSRKEKRALEREHLYLINKDMLENRNFVLESDYLQNRYGYRIPVNSTINFVMVNADEAVIQIGSDYGLGYNGVGGITAKGRITKWELNENEKKKSFDLSMHVMTNIGMYEVNMSVGLGMATARLTSLSRGNLTFSGDIVALNESVVYEGSSL